MPSAAHVGEVGQAETARRVLLAEDHILLGSVQRPPRPHAPLQRAADARADLGMATPQISARTAMARMPGAAFRIGTISAVPYVGQRIGPPSSARGLLLRRQARIGLDPVAGGGREPGLRGGDGDVVVG